MSTKEIRLYKTIARWGILALMAVGLLCRCASQAAPRGGPRDSLAPKVISMLPAFGTTNFKDKRIVIEFDEYVQLKELQKEFFTSPFMTKKPVVLLRGKKVQIDLKEDLDSNRTYSLNFGSSIRDNNEGNPYTGLRYVFSTGDRIDSLLMSGMTVDAMKGDTVGNVYILFFDARADSIPAYDSTLFKSKPLSVGRSYPNGIFIAENLQPIDYRIYALEDRNGNMTYEPGVDRVAFLDSVYNPLDQRSFDIWYDTTRRYLQADPQIQMRMFMDVPYKRQTFTGAARQQSNKVQISFTAPFPQIDELTFEGIEPEKIVTEYLTPRRDSMVLWFAATEEEMPDTLRGKLVYQRHDSIGNLYQHTQELKLGWKIPEKKVKEKEKEKKKEGDAPEPNPFRVKVAGGTTLNPEKNIVFEFDYPLLKFDSASVQLSQLGEGGAETASPFRFEQDTMKIRKWTLKAPWKADEKYRLTILPGTFENTNREKNDTLRSEFTIESPDKYGTLVLNVQGKTPESEYMVQVVKPDGSLIKEVAHLKTGTHTLRYIDVGPVRLRLIEDLNGNGKWDAGSLTERRQPERVEFFTDDSGSEELTIKEKWDLVYDVDMNGVFGPVTMEKMQDKIRRDEAVMLRERAKKLAEKEKQDKKQHSHSNSGGGISSGMNNMGNMGGNLLR